MTLAPAPGWVPRYYDIRHLSIERRAYSYPCSREYTANASRPMSAVEAASESRHLSGQSIRVVYVLCERTTQEQHACRFVHPAHRFGLHAGYVLDAIAANETAIEQYKPQCQCRLQRVYNFLRLKR